MSVLIHVLFFPLLNCAPSCAVVLFVICFLRSASLLLNLCFPISEFLNQAFGIYNWTSVRLWSILKLNFQNQNNCLNFRFFLLCVRVGWKQLDSSFCFRRLPTSRAILGRRQKKCHGGTRRRAFCSSLGLFRCKSRCLLQRKLYNKMSYEKRFELGLQIHDL